MESDIPAKSGLLSLPGQLLRHIIHMPAWHRHVLTIAAALASVGIVGHVRQRLGTPSASTPSSNSQTTVIAPNSSSGSGFVQSTDPNASGADANNSSGTAVDQTANPQPWYLSPQFLGIGGSVLGGFIIGWITRTFVKTVTLIAAAGMAILGGLSYFHVMNVDFTAVHQQYDTAMGYLTDQASRLKDVAIAYLPVHAGALFGAFLGFRRR